MKIHEIREGLILAVSVKPRSKEFRIVVDGDQVVAYVGQTLLREESTGS